MLISLFNDLLRKFDCSIVSLRQTDDLQIYTSGATNIFKYPELSDTQKASELLSTLEQKEMLKGLFDDKQLPAASDSQIQV